MYDSTGRESLKLFKMESVTGVFSRLWYLVLNSNRDGPDGTIE